MYISILKPEITRKHSKNAYKKTPTENQKNTKWGPFFASSLPVVRFSPPPSIGYATEMQRGSDLW